MKNPFKHFFLWLFNPRLAECLKKKEHLKMANQKLHAAVEALKADDVAKTAQIADLSKQLSDAAATTAAATAAAVAPLQAQVADLTAQVAALTQAASTSDADDNALADSAAI